VSADLILYNLKALTFAGQGTAPELIGIKGDKISYVGEKAALSDLRGLHTQLVDCAGGVVVPGFNDAHCHPLAFAITLRYVDCSGRRVRAIASLQALLRESARALSGDRWLRAANYDVSALAEKRPLNRWELDRAVPHLPVVLIEKSGQHCVLNSRALDRCGIAEGSSDSAGGRIHRDPVTGIPDGVVSGNNEALAKAIPPLTDQEIEVGVGEANKKYLSMGITSLQDTSWSNGYQHWLAMKGFKERGLLAPRVTLLPGIDALGQFTQRGLKTGSGDDQLRLGAVKIALDESTGNLRPPQGALNQAALGAHLAGFQLAFHVSDVYMLQISLQALEFVRQVAPLELVRPRFEHCPVCPPALLPEIARSGAMVVSQPNLLYATGPQYLQEASPEQLSWVYPFNSFLKHGISLAFGSDSPLTACDPLRAIHTAATRVVEGGAAVTSSERIQLLDAFKCYTYGGAYASLEEDRKGSVSVGRLADLVVLDGDVTRTTPEAPIDTKVLVTLIDGKITWES